MQLMQKIQFCDPSMTTLENLEKSCRLQDAPKEVIMAVQMQLIALKLLDSVPDGKAGKLTMTAFAKFKELEYLEYPDLLGKSTAIALLETTNTRAAPKDFDAALLTEHKAFFPKIGWVAAGDLVHDGGHFSWGEFTKNLARVPQSERVVDGIARLAYYLEGVRNQFGNPVITINSGYRPPVINQAVGGASNSQHLYGAAADIVVSGIRPHEVYTRINRWHGDKGGLGDSGAFTHIDLRGYRARWNYGNA